MCAPAAADERAGARNPPATPPDWSVEVAGEVYREAWNYNVSDEDLFGGSAGLWYRLDEDWSVGGETLVFWAHQERVPSAPVTGFTLLGRRHVERARHSWFGEAFGGISYAGRFVPSGGTRFNYLAGGAVGFIHATSRYAHLIASFRFLHISNNGLAGRDRNPDIEAFGIRAGVVLPISPP